MGHLWLIGMMGAGKTLVGRLVAARTGKPVVDMDAEIAARLGCSIGQLWGMQGEEAFRDLEAALVTRLVDAPESVIATGGGAVTREENVAAMRSSGTVVWLEAPVATLARRVGDGEGRPLLSDDATVGRLAELLDLRQDLYAAAADHRVSTEDAGPDEVAEVVAGLWTGS